MGDCHCKHATESGQVINFDAWAREFGFAVINPNGVGQVERLAIAYAAISSARSGDEYRAWENRSPEARDRIIEDLAAALREFANPTPPKPDEPTGLGAVVEDAEGRRWMRGSSTRGLKVWVNDDALDSEWRAYRDIAAVRVLSEGVTA